MLLLSIDAVTIAPATMGLERGLGGAGRAEEVAIVADDDFDDQASDAGAPSGHSGRSKE